MLDRPAAWVGSSARDIAHAVRRGDTSATAVVADHLDQIRTYDRILGAFREVRAAAAVTEAEIVDELPELSNLPLAGVPIAIKENLPVTGLPTWYGSAAARQPVATSDHEWRQVRLHCQFHATTGLFRLLSHRGSRMLKKVANGEFFVTSAGAVV